MSGIDRERIEHEREYPHKRLWRITDQFRPLLQAYGRVWERQAGIAPEGGGSPMETYEEEVAEVEGPIIAEIAKIEMERDAARTALAAAEAREAKLREALEGVVIYGSDTLSGPVPPQRHDLIWARDGIREMVRRARTALTDKGDTDNDG